MSRNMISNELQQRQQVRGMPTKGDCVFARRRARLQARTLDATVASEQVVQSRRNNTIKNKLKRMRLYRWARVVSLGARVQYIRVMCYLVRLPVVGRGFYRLHKLPRAAWQAGFMCFVLMVSLLLYVGRAHAATQGPLSPSTGSGWTSSGSVTAQDSIYASSGSIAAGGTSATLSVTGFGFTIPTGSTINGVQATVYKYAPSVSRSTVEDNSVQLIVGGTAGGTSQATATAWPTSDSSVNYGGSSNMWGYSLLVTDVNASNFGVAISAINVKSGGGASNTAYIDYVSLTITYTPPPLSTTQATYRLFNNKDASSNTSFATAWGSSANNEGRSVIQTGDGGYAEAGDTQSFVAGDSNYDAYLAKYDSKGNLQWSRTWGSTVTADNGYGLAQTSDGGYVLTGNTYSYGPSSGGSAFLLKYSSSGTLQWSRTWGGSGTSASTGRKVIQTSDGGFAIVGDTNAFGAGSADAFLAKFDSSGNLSWSRTWGGSGAEEGDAVVQTPDGGYAMTGNTASLGATIYDAFLAKFDSSGNLSWSRTWGGSGQDHGYSIANTTDGGYAIGGNSNSFGAGSYDGILLKYSSSGTLQWSRTWGGATFDDAYSIIQTSDGGYALSGDTSSYGEGSYDAFLAKFDSSGNLSWSRTWGGNGAGNMNQETAYGLIQTSDGGYAMTGTVKSYGAGGTDAFLLKYDSSGNINGCPATQCESDTVGGGGNYTSITKKDTIGGGSDYTSISRSDTVGGGSDYTSSTFKDTVGGGSNYTSTTWKDTIGGGSDYTSISRSDTVGGGSDYTSTVTPLAGGNPIMNVDTALAGLNTPAIIPGDGQPFRVRVTVGVSGSTVTANAASFKLQYAPMGASCAATSTSSYSDVTNATTVRYYDNPNAANGLALATNTNDPTDGTNPIIPETYQESGTTTFTNPTAIPSGSDGMWDFALTMYHTIQNTHYCLRIVNATDGSGLNNYTTYPELITPSATMSQGNYRFFQPGGAGSMTFAKAWGSSSADEGDAVTQTADGGYVVAGYTDNVGNAENVLLNKYDSSGNLTWTTTWGGTSAINYDAALGVIQTSDGGYAVAGTTSNYGAGSNDILLLKFNSSGVLQWNSVWGGTGADYGKGLVQTSDGGYAVAGYVTGGASGKDAVVVKFTSTGAYSWNTTWGLGTSDEATSIINTSNGGFAVSGDCNPITGSNMASLVILDSSGNITANYEWPGVNTSNIATGVIQTSDGGYAETGYENSDGAGNNDAYLLKFNSSGTLSWSARWGGSGDDKSYQVVQTNDGGYVIGGQTASFTGNGFLAKFDSSGNYNWSRTFDVASNGFAHMASTSDNGYVATGKTTSYGTAGDMFISKMDSSGNIIGCTTYCSVPTNPVTTPQSISTSSSSLTKNTFSGTFTNPTVTTNNPSGTITTIVAVAGGAAVGQPLANQNASYDVPRRGVPFRLRMLLRENNSGISSSGVSFKLQYASKNGSCSTSSFFDVTTGTAVAWYDDSNVAGGTGLVASANDPADGSNTSDLQAYQESNNFTNSASAVYVGEDGLWDFSLVVPSGMSSGIDICLRAVDSSGTVLSSYEHYPEIQYGPSTSSRLRQGLWFDQNGAMQPFFLDK